MTMSRKSLVAMGITSLAIFAACGGGIGSGQVSGGGDAGSDGSLSSDSSGGSSGGEDSSSSSSGGVDSGSSSGAADSGSSGGSVDSGSSSGGVDSGSSSGGVDSGNDAGEDGGTVTPASFSGLVLWLRADLGVTQSGGAVSTWADQSGSGNDVIQSNSLYQPTYTAAGINGLPSIRTTLNEWFYLASGTPSSVITTSAAERFFVAQNATDPPTGGPFTGAVEGFWGTSHYETNVPYTDGLIYDGWCTATRQNGIAHTGVSLASPYIYDSYSQASDWEAFLNGTNIYTTSTNTFGAYAYRSPILGGTVSVVGGSPTITFSQPQTLAAGTQLSFDAQQGVIYTLANAVDASTSGTLSGNYGGTTDSAATTVSLTLILGPSAVSEFSEYVVYNRVLTSSERTSLTRYYFGTRYGIPVQ